VGFVDNGNGTGTLSGTPGAGTAGSYPITFTASNGVPPNAVQNFTLTVVCPAITVNPAAGALPEGLFGVAYSQVFTATGGTGPHTFAITAGAVPGGLNLSSGGTLSGSPNNTGNFSFTVTATDAFACTGSTAYTLLVRPNAQGDTYMNGVGNTQFVVGASTPSTPNVFVSGTVLGNDAGPAPLSVSPASITSTNGGSVAMGTNGTFTYTPAVGFAGPSDTFTYTLTDGNGITNTATVTINLSDVVWYVDNTYAGANGASDGRSHRPFTTLNAAETPSLANQYIFVHQGSGNTSGGIALDSGQTLWGQGATFTLHGLTIAATGRPTVTGTITLNSSVTVRALNVSTGAGTGVNDPAGAITGVALSEVSVTTTTGTAVLLSDLGGTLSFTSVSANGGANGISLQNTTGSVTVTGTGTAASGGTIANMTGADGSTGGIGIYMNNVQNVSLDRMQLNNFSNFGIRGTAVNGFALANSTINAVGAGATNGNVQAEGTGEGSIRFDNLVGTASITNSTVTHGVYDNVGIFNTNTATALNLTVSGSTFATATAVATGNDALRIEIDDTVAGAPQAQATITIQNSNFTAARGDVLDVIAQKSIASAANAAVVTLNVTGNNFSNNHGGIVSGGGGITLHGQGTLTFTVDDNDMQDARGRALNISKGATAGVFSGTVNNNRIGLTGVAFSGSDESSGIFVDGGGAGSMTVAITNNTVRRTNEAGIFIVANNQAVSGNNATLNATITGNLVAEGEAFTFAGLWADIGSGVASDTTTACLDIGGSPATLQNDFSNGDPADFGDISLSVQSGSVMRFPGYGGANNNDGQITSYLTGRNANAATTSVSLSHTGTMTTSAGSCVQP